jgi:hypothetical protein
MIIHRENIGLDLAVIGTAISIIGVIWNNIFLLRSKQQKARDFSRGMNASSYQQTRSIISMANV